MNQYVLNMNILTISRMPIRLMWTQVKDLTVNSNSYNLTSSSYFKYFSLTFKSSLNQHSFHFNYICQAIWGWVYSNYF